MKFPSINKQLQSQVDSQAGRFRPLEDPGWARRRAGSSLNAVVRQETEAGTVGAPPTPPGLQTPAPWSPSV